MPATANKEISISDVDHGAVAGKPKPSKLQQVPPTKKKKGSVGSGTGTAKAKSFQHKPAFTAKKKKSVAGGARAGKARSSQPKAVFATNGKAKPTGANSGQASKAAPPRARARAGQKESIHIKREAPSPPPSTPPPHKHAKRNGASRTAKQRAARAENPTTAARRANAPHVPAHRRGDGAWFGVGRGEHEGGRDAAGAQTGRKRAAAKAPRPLLPHPQKAPQPGAHAQRPGSTSMSAEAIAAAHEAPAPTTAAAAHAPTNHNGGVHLAALLVLGSPEAAQPILPTLDDPLSSTAPAPAKDAQAAVAADPPCRGGDDSDTGGADRGGDAESKHKDENENGAASASASNADFTAAADAGMARDPIPFPSPGTVAAYIATNSDAEYDDTPGYDGVASMDEFFGLPRDEATYAFGSDGGSNTANYGGSDSYGTSSSSDGDSDMGEVDGEEGSVPRACQELDNPGCHLTWHGTWLSTWHLRQHDRALAQIRGQS